MGRVVHYGIQHVSFRHNLSTDTSAQWLKRIVAYFIFTSMLRRIATTTAGTVAVGSITYVSSRRKKKKHRIFNSRFVQTASQCTDFRVFFFSKWASWKGSEFIHFFDFRIFLSYQSCQSHSTEEFQHWFSLEGRWIPMDATRIMLIST